MVKLISPWHRSGYRTGRLADERFHASCKYNTLSGRLVGMTVKDGVNLSEDLPVTLASLSACRDDSTENYSALATSAAK